jgi:predicted kinase
MLHPLIQDADVVIMRGISGSGKTYFAKQNLSYHVVASANDYFTVNGRYLYDRERLGEAHEYCFNMFMRGIEDGERVVVDNTNIELKEFEKYVVTAMDYGLKTCVVNLLCPPAVAFRRATHGVPLDKIIWTFERLDKVWVPEELKPEVFIYNG